ncbi:MAG: metallophosphoesterase, partial [Gammaproteobacteria bacterium]|nr:metallophosphoesterase [Gammaproteobacteria bacterium]
MLLAGCPALDPPDLTPDPDAGGTHLVRLVHITDPQIVDEESPARSVRTDGIIGVSWRPQEDYAIHTLDATLHLINTIHERGGAEGRPVDFVVMTGDLADLAQFNELQWFMDTMDGKVVTPDSGVADGAARDRLEARNPKLPYAATGLDTAIPWYTCYGNHDALATGNFAIDRGASNPEEWFAPLFPIVADVIGYHLLDPAWDFMLPTADRSPAIVTGSGPPLGPDGLQVDLAALEAGPIAPDPARRFLSKRDFIALHLESTGSPAGHGFSQAALSRGETWFSVRPLSDVPVRLIVFDTVAAGAHYGLPLYYGALTRQHLDNFIIPALEAATKAGEWIVLASHHPPDDFAIPFPDATVGTDEFHAAVSRYPGVVLHLVGHTHRNRARTIPGTFPYIEIETSAIIDFPQEG